MKPKRYVAGGQNKKAACLECASAIPKNARKCSECGSYQNWRRHLDFGQATFAFALSVVAISGYIALLSDRLSFSQGFEFSKVTKLSFRGNENEVSMLLQNESSLAAYIEKIDCLINVPVNDLEGRLKSRNLSNQNNAKIGTVGLFSLQYETNPAIQMQAREHKMITSKIVSSIGPLSWKIELTTEESSYCVITGVRADGSKVSDLALINFDEVLDYNLEAMIQNLPIEVRESLAAEIESYMPEF